MRSWKTLLIAKSIDLNQGAVFLTHFEIELALSSNLGKILLRLWKILFKIFEIFKIVRLEEIKTS